MERGEGTTGRQANCSWQRRKGKKGDGVGFFFFFGSEVAVVVALAQLSSVVPSISVAVPLVLPALPPALVVVATVAVGSPGWWSKNRAKGNRR